MSNKEPYIPAGVQWEEEVCTFPVQDSNELVNVRMKTHDYRGLIEDREIKLKDHVLVFPRNSVWAVWWPRFDVGGSDHEPRHLADRLDVQEESIVRSSVPTSDSVFMVQSAEEWIAQTSDGEALRTEALNSGKPILILNYEGNDKVEIDAENGEVEKVAVTFDTLNRVFFQGHEEAMLEVQVTGVPATFKRDGDEDGENWQANKWMSVSDFTKEVRRKGEPIHHREALNALNNYLPPDTPLSKLLNEKDRDFLRDISTGGCELRAAVQGRWETADPNRPLQYLTAIQWLLFASCFASSLAHADSNGLATIIFSLLGSKLWSICAPSVVGPLSEDAKQSYLIAHLLPFLSGKVEDMLDEKRSGRNVHAFWDNFVTVFSTPRSVIMVPPGGIHFVNTYEDNISIGLHFLYFCQFWLCFVTKLGESLNTMQTNTWHPDIQDRLDAIMYHYVKLLSPMSQADQAVFIASKDPTADRRNWKGLAHLVLHAEQLAGFPQETEHLSSVDRKETLKQVKVLYRILGVQKPPTYRTLCSALFPGIKKSVDV